jgi:nucleotide-binding universal stress UspA family protein
MSRILVAIDGSPESEKALELAVQQALAENGQITALAILDRPGDPRPDRPAVDALAAARRRLEQVLRAAVTFARSRGLRLTPVLREGHLAETIVACAKQEGAELVVLGGHDLRALRSGSCCLSDRVINHAHCSVMVVECGHDMDDVISMAAADFHLTRWLGSEAPAHPDGGAPSVRLPRERVENVGARQGCERLSPEDAGPRLVDLFEDEFVVVLSTACSANSRTGR